MSSLMQYTVIKSEPLVPDLDTWEQEQEESLLFGGDLFISSQEEEQYIPQRQSVQNTSVVFVEPYAPVSYEVNQQVTQQQNTYQSQQQQQPQFSPVKFEYKNTYHSKSQQFIDNNNNNNNAVSFGYSSESDAQSVSTYRQHSDTSSSWLEQPVDILEYCTQSALEGVEQVETIDVVDVEAHDQDEDVMPVDESVPDQQLAILREIRSAAAAFEKSQSPDTINSGRSSTSLGSSFSPISDDEDSDSDYTDEESSSLLTYGPLVGQSSKSSSLHGVRRKRTREERREIKKHQNRVAATRYRIKKRVQKETLEEQLETETKRNRSLKSRVEDMSYEISYLKKLIEEVRAAQQSK